MNKTRPVTTTEILSDVEQLANLHFIDNFALLDTSIFPTSEEVLAEHKAEVAISFAIKAKTSSCQFSVWYNLH
jgi:hypothetical protein